MATVAKTTVSFVKQFVALIKGDDDEALAQKVFRQADAALNTHIAILKGELINKEESLETAKENQIKALLNNGKQISDRDSYVEGILAAENAVIQAEKALKAHQDKLALLESKSALISEAV